MAGIDLWLEYIIRFSHFVAGIAWIGSSFYFIWLDSSFEPPQTPKKNVEGELFMVHGGFYYQVEKRKIFPGELPKVLHWFKWEATLTWITGFLLLIYVYYLKGASLLALPGVGQAPTILYSLGLIIGSWLVYDFVWHPKFEKYKPLSLVISIFLFAFLILTNFKLFSGRGAFIQTGVIFGSIMLLNVWVRILPGQKKMIADAQAGKIPDYSLSLKSKTRSVHNTYFTFPVLFIMLSNHYPLLYNHQYNAYLLVILALSGALVRHAMVTKNKRQRWVLLPAAFGLWGLVYLTQPKEIKNSEELVTFAKVQPIIQARCVSCHSANPTDDVFIVPPKGTIFETEQQLLGSADLVYQMVVENKFMPLANKTNMSEEERLVIHNWLKDKINKH